MSPQEAASVAAQQRQQKNQTGTGKLSNQLNKERRQNRAQLLSQNNKQVEEPLIYD